MSQRKGEMCVHGGGWVGCMARWVVRRCLLSVSLSDTKLLMDFAPPARSIRSIQGYLSKGYHNQNHADALFRGSKIGIAGICDVVENEIEFFMLLLTRTSSVKKYGRRM